MSEPTLDLLIERLKREAIEKSEQKAEEIITEARRQAENLIAEAESQKRSILDEAEREAEATVERGKAALRVAARDMAITAKNDLLQLLRSALEEEIRRSFDADLMKKIISHLVEQVGQGARIQLPEDQLKELSHMVKQQFQETVSSVTILQDKSSGIVIKKEGSGWSYEISPEQVLEALLPHLNTTWSAILSENNAS